jgi:hypothetical protein
MKNEAKLMIQDFLKEAEKKLPDLCTERDVAALGLVTINQLKRLRKTKDSFPYLRAKGRIIYLRDDVISWIKSIYCTASK